MIGVTIGIGSGWEPVAQRAANRMAELTGLDCHVIKSFGKNQFEHATWMKYKIPELFPNEDSFLYFDADVWCMKPWNPMAVFETAGSNFCGARTPKSVAVVNECQKAGLNPDIYMQAGLFMFSWCHFGLLDEVLSMHPAKTLWYDQTPLNVVLQNRTDWELLERSYNAEATHGKFNEAAIGIPFEQVINLHFVSCGTPERIEALQKL